MFAFLKNHPFAVEAYFESSIVLTFAVSKEKLVQLIPKTLTLDTLDGHYGFLAVALVKTTQLRPKGFPKVFGNDFFLIGYRIFVKYENEKGKKRRGLYILKSETNRKKMEILGNIFSHYNYSTTDIQQQKKGKEHCVSSKKSNFQIEYSEGDINSELPAQSPFINWKEARKYAGPLPFTFNYDIKKNEMLIIEGIRNNWKPIPIIISQYRIEFLKELKLDDAILANAFIINHIPYSWKKGIKEKCSN